MRFVSIFALSSAALAACVVATGCGNGGGINYLSAGWKSYGGNPQHTAMSHDGTQPLKRVLWSAPIDLNPQYSGSSLLIHYGCPLISALDTVVLTVKTGAAGGFRVEGRELKTGKVKWTEDTDYILPNHNWTPPVGSAIVGIMGLVTPAGGGTLMYRASVDEKQSMVSRMSFYGTSLYEAHKDEFDQNVRICTPITVDEAGSIYFGFKVYGPNAANLTSGYAKINSAGKGSWVSAQTLSGDENAPQAAMNCAPAISNDGKIMYVAVNNGGFSGGYLVSVDTATMKMKNRVRLVDPKSGNPSIVPDDGTATPMVGPDGDVYYGVLENPFGENHFRGFLQHFDKTLNVTKTPGAFGWDDTPSVVPSSAVKAYHGTSKYLILAKYNNYAGAGGDGANRVAILDPNASAVESISGVTTMKEVISVLGATKDSEFPNSPNAVREWCINTAAIDVKGRAAIVNNEDGKCYRWNFDTNTLSETMRLTSGVGEAYTPTIVSRHGESFAINNARVYVLGR
ncbi:hypothetical protein [Fimbriimonas ginsengisoli]|uniref:Pyrrolo-quinoline quinone n=1 Tax=Fimbriimonas ginsengisoli Gsoil 348 TaxID=661478 RepID=A0A068NM48_FIMGI|nr:hypothetical protein [Fimbriimonas ginsengisoli]AIE83860.1 hypothetical protein OP10G_0492 [Fimbriimonas ginsengisoli Gsoil 348]